MKIQNQTTKSLAVSDLLIDAQSQYQSGIKYLTLAPNGDAGGNDFKVIPNALAAESASLKALMADGSVLIVDNDEQLGSQNVFGAVAGLGVIAFDGVIKTDRDEGGTDTFRMMFGTPVVGDEIIDQQVHGFNVAAVGDVHVIEHLLTLSGTVVTVVKATAAVSGNVILTWVGAAATDQAAISVYAKLG